MGAARLLRGVFPLLAIAACGRSTALVQDSGVGGAGTRGSKEAAGAGGTSGEGAAGSTSGPGGAAGATVDQGGGGPLGGADAGEVAGATGTGGAPADDGGDGRVVEPNDGGADSFPGVPLPPYTGGIVDVVNSGNWNETIHPFSQRRMLVRDEGDPHLVLLDFSRTDPVVWKNVTNGPWSRGEQLIGNNQVMGSRPDGYEVFDLATGTIVKTVHTFSGTQAAYRMANGETMLTRSGARLDFLDKSDQIAHEISYPGFSYVRLAHPTRNGTFLVPSDTQVFEGDALGNVLWKVTAPTGNNWSHVFEAMQMSDGNTILSTFFGSSLDVIDKTTHLVTKRYGTKTIPNAAVIRPNGFSEFQILPNGNLIVANWETYGGLGREIIEFNPNGDVIWTYQQDPKVFSAIQGVLVLDGLDPQLPHALEISPDSTWQPVPSP
ncbi:MAG: hypothetical protein JWM82_2370 [Myxococcales bacterium]|nr:hypothetical protein [Myxococcales bacterium]